MSKTIKLNNEDVKSRKHKVSFYLLLLWGMVFLCGCDSDEKTLDELLLEQQGRVASETTEESITAETGDEIQTLWVHICGYVKKPGIYELPKGSRVYDCLMAAGGFSDGADETTLNLADYLQDGTKIYVPGLLTDIDATMPLQGSSLQTQTSGVSVKSEVLSEDEKVNINIATAEQLQTLPGIGEKRAREIISYRESNGPFESIEDIQNISGIKTAIYTKIKDLITVR